MRLRGTKYEKLQGDFPTNAMTCREYAEANNMCSGIYVQGKYDRFINGKGKDPGYVIKCWNGINIVIPHNN